MCKRLDSTGGQFLRRLSPPVSTDAAPLAPEIDQLCRTHRRIFARAEVVEQSGELFTTVTRTAELELINDTVFGKDKLEVLSKLFEILFPGAAAAHLRSYIRW